MVTAPGCSVAVWPGPARHKSLIKQLEVRTGPDETIMPSRLHTSPWLPPRSKALDDSGFIRAAGWVFVTAAAGASPSCPRPQLSMTDTDLSSPSLLQLLARPGPSSGTHVSDVWRCYTINTWRRHYKWALKESPLEIVVLFCKSCHRWVNGQFCGSLVNKPLVLLARLVAIWGSNTCETRLNKRFLMCESINRCLF